MRVSVVPDSLILAPRRHRKGVFDPIGGRGGRGCQIKRVRRRWRAAAILLKIPCDAAWERRIGMIGNAAGWYVVGGRDAPVVAAKDEQS